MLANAITYYVPSTETVHLFSVDNLLAMHEKGLGEKSPRITVQRPAEECLFNRKSASERAQKFHHVSFGIND